MRIMIITCLLLAACDNPPNTSSKDKDVWKCVDGFVYIQAGDIWAKIDGKRYVGFPEGPIACVDDNKFRGN